MEAFFRLVVRFRVAVIVACLVITALFARELPKLRMEPDAEAYVPENHPIRVFWKEAKERFGLGREILVAVQADGRAGVFTPEILAGVATLTDALSEVDGVDASQVRSLSTSEAIVGTEEGLEVEPFFGDEPPSTRREVREVRRRVFDNPVFLDRLVSRDGTIAAILVKAEIDGDEATDVYARVAEVVERHPVPGARVLVAGMPAVEYVYGRQMAADLKRLIPLALVAVVAILYVCFPSVPLRTLGVRAGVAFACIFAWHAFRGGGASVEELGTTTLVSVVLAFLTVPGVFLPSLIVGMAVVWTWGAQAMLGLPIYIAGTLVPPLLLAIGCAHAIHVIETYAERLAAPDTDARAALVATMSDVWLPIVLASVTTAAGFGSLTLGSMAVYRVFGATTAFGLMVAMVLSLTFLPAGLALLAVPPAKRTAGRMGRLSRALVALAERLEGRRTFVLGASAAVLVVFGVYATGLRVDYSWVESLAPDTPVLEADRVLRSRHGGTTPLNVIVRTPEIDGVKDPALLRAIDRVLERIATHPAVGDTRSIAEYVKRMHQAMNENRIEAYAIPDSRELVAQYLLLYSMSGDPTEYDDLTDYDYQAANLSILLRTDRLSVIREVTEQLSQILDEELRPLGATATMTGSAIVLETVLGMVVDSQIGSLGSATLMVALFLWIFFRSLRDALICLLPMGVTAVVNFGAMALLDIPLGPDKAMIGAIALGLGIDYSIHLMARFHGTLARGMTVAQGVVESMRSTGRAILFNGAVVVAGFLVLGTSATPSNATFGLMIASNIALACATAMVVVPAALALVGSYELRRAANAPVRIGGRLLDARTARALGLTAPTHTLTPARDR